MADEDRKLATNSAVIITIVAIIIYIVPVVLYSWYSFFKLFGSYSIDDMILQYENRNYELNMEYNTLQDMYLFCTYIPSKRKKECDNRGEEGVAIAIDNMNIKKIIKKI